MGKLLIKVAITCARLIGLWGASPFVLPLFAR
jgi:hypothetical protein